MPTEVISRLHQNSANPHINRLESINPNTDGAAFNNPLLFQKFTNNIFLKSELDHKLTQMDELTAFMYDISEYMPVPEVSADKLCYGYAYQYGINQARGQYIVMGDADVVNGTRYLNGKGRNTPAYRRPGQKVLYDVELNRPLYYYTVPGMVVRTTGPGRRLNIVNAKYQRYDHGS